MTCPDCGHENPDGARFCSNCGAQLAAAEREPSREERKVVTVLFADLVDSMELTEEPSFRERGILQTMTHGERTMAMPTWPVRFDGVPTEVKPAPLLGQHTADVLADWLGLNGDAVAGLRRDGIV